MTFIDGFDHDLIASHSPAAGHISHFIASMQTHDRIYDLEINSLARTLRAAKIDHKKRLRMLEASKKRLREMSLRSFLPTESDRAVEEDLLYEELKASMLWSDAHWIVWCSQ